MNNGCHNFYSTVLEDPGFLPAPADKLWAEGKVNPEAIIVGRAPSFAVKMMGRALIVWISPIQLQSVTHVRHVCYNMTPGEAPSLEMKPIQVAIAGFNSKDGTAAFYGIAPTMGFVPPDQKQLHGLKNSLVRSKSGAKQRKASRFLLVECRLVALEIRTNASDYENAIRKVWGSKADAVPWLFTMGFCWNDLFGVIDIAQIFRIEEYRQLYHEVLQQYPLSRFDGSPQKAFLQADADSMVICPSYQLLDLHGIDLH